MYSNFQCSGKIEHRINVVVPLVMQTSGDKYHAVELAWQGGVSYVLVKIFLSPFSFLQKHRNFQHLPYKIKSQVSVSYYYVLLQFSLLVLALPGWCCKVRSVVHCLLQTALQHLHVCSEWCVFKQGHNEDAIWYSEIKNNRSFWLLTQPTPVLILNLFSLCVFLVLFSFWW